MDQTLVETTVRALSHSQVFQGRAKGLHVIVEGSAQILKRGTPLTILGRGAFFGEISLFGVSLERL
jgi:hypothetical protein